MPKQILVADDEPALLLSLSHILKKEGYKVLTATNGQEAYDLASSNLPDLVMLDIQMPRMDGNEVCRRLRDEPASSSLYIIMVTAKGQESDRINSLENGANEYITKPYSPKKVIARVKEILGE